MKLKSLRIKGFKSFADETLIHFDRGITGIVGPNGSGKSNIVDAIRWVLGEQKSTELRLSNMSDVLFNGSERRKPAPYARVTIEFENDRGLLPTEYQTVSISRTLFRSGDSEYRLNDVRCRRKDITDLLIDTGIGSNTYAIIELGMVEEILADKDNARRKMFEQAAGVAKFKKRKHETQLKLKSTQEDLNRVEDLLHELEGQLQTLRRQAQKAQRLERLQQQRKHLSITLAYHRTKDIDTALQRIRHSITSLAQQLADKKAQLARDESTLQQKKKQNLDKELSVNSKRRTLSDWINQIQKLEAERDALKHRQEFLQFEIRRLDQSKSEYRDTLRKINERIEHLQQQLAELQKKLQEAQAHKEQCEAHYLKVKEEYEQRQAQQQNKEERIKEYQRQKSHYEREIAVLSAKLQQLKDQLQQLNTKETDLNEQLRALHTQKVQLECERQSVQLQLDQKTKQYNQKQQELQHVQRDVQQLQQELRQQERQLDAAQNEYQLLKSVHERLEGYPESVRQLHKYWNGKVPLLSDIIDVPDPYRPAIEAYLGHYLHYFIVDTTEQARQAIEWLRTGQKGMASFFVLEQFSNTPHSTTPSTSELTPAIHIVQTEEKYLPVISQLLGHVYLSSDLQQPLPAEEAVLLHPETGVWKSKYAMGGGALDLFVGKKLGRKLQLEKLKDKVQELHKTVQRTQDHLQALQQKRHQLEQDIQQLDIESFRERLAALDQRMKQLHAQQQWLQTQIDDIQQQRIAIDRNQQEWQQLLTQSIEKRDAINRDLHQLQQVAQPLDGKDIEALQQQLLQWSEKRQQAQITLVELQHRLQAAKREIQQLKNQRHNLLERLEAEAKQRQQSQRDLDQLRSRLKQLHTELDALHQKKSELQSTLQSEEEALYKEKNALLEEEKRLAQLRKDIETLREKLDQWQSEEHQLEMKRTELAERMKVQFDVELDDIFQSPPELPDDLTPEQIEEKLRKIQQRIDSMGAVNPLAHEAYVQLQERYDHIVTQRDDILKARDSLEKTMDEIESQAVELYMNAFERVRANFKEVFRRLFHEGDDCDLVLLHPDDPLHSPIEIVAKPRGKRPRTLRQLSGGEKTLTAIALLFSLYLLKPAPFCIFDEVDAPLDDTNVMKFNQIIREFSQQSQFIVVTHNKLTMAEIDRLYGVFMQESGVSGVAEVSFKDLPQNIETLTA